MILLAGGGDDPNVRAIGDRLAMRRVPHVRLLGARDRWPRFAWALDADRLEIDGRELRPSAVFVRFDVFAELRDKQAESRRRAAEWYYAVLAWALSHPDVTLPNRGFATRHAVKPLVLAAARRAGLEIAATVVTNDLATLDGLDADGWIVKPVDGGALTQSLRARCADAAGLEAFARAPGIVQRRLVPPDLRIFRVGAAWFAFELRGDADDYRAGGELRVDRVEPAPDLAGPLEALTDEMGLDFAAADFKLRPDHGRFVFLEVNSAPMFASLDGYAGGAISDALIDLLAQPSRPGLRPMAEAADPNGG